MSAAAFPVSLAVAVVALLALPALSAIPVSAQATGGVASSGDASDPVEEARRLLDAGLPVTAGRALSRALSEGRAEGREVVLVAARAHAAYRAWAGVLRLLEGQDWLDEGAGEGRRLLARAHLELDRPARALEYYERLAEGRPAGTGGGAPWAAGMVGESPREAGPDPATAVGHATALSRLARHAEAAETLLSAASRHPDPAPWLRLEALRELAAAADTARAAPLAGALLRHRAIPADSVRGELALAAFRAGDTRRGLALARSTSGTVRAALDGEWGAPALLAAGDTVEAVAALRRSLAAARAPPEAGTLLMTLDPGWRAAMEAGEDDLRAGRRERGKARLERALREAPPRQRPSLAARLAAARGAEGDHGGALAILAPWLEDGDAPAEERAELWMAAYRAWNGLGREGRADGALSRAADADAGADAGTEVSGLASFLLADRHHDREDRAAAREAYRSTLARFPRTRYAELAVARLGMLDFLEARYEGAEEWFATYRRRFPGGEWYHGALYWQARSREAAGDAAASRALYRETLGHAPLAYYGMRAAERLGADPWEELGLREASVPPLSPEGRRLLARMETLRGLGWSDRARAELRAAADGAPRGDGAGLALALALNEAGWTSEGVGRAWAIHRRSGRWTPPLLRAVHPLPYREALRRAAEARGLDAAFVAAVARRESLFDREILSPVGARGIMQLMPATASAVARRAGLPEFRQDQLDVPEVNLLMGTLYLAEMLERFEGSRVAALVSYNAGPHRWLRWRDLPEAAEEEILIERIPFRETREYARAVLALETIYRRLYGEGP